MVVVALVIFENDQASNDGAQGYRQGSSPGSHWILEAKIKKMSRAHCTTMENAGEFWYLDEFHELGELQTVAGHLVLDAG